MQLPARIGKYELQQFLGGGMSHVYRAVDTVIGRTVAVKILTEQGCEDAEAKARFLAEARMAGNISHDNVLSIYDFGEDEQHHPYMVMEFLRGEDLRHAIRDGHTGELKGKLKIAVQTARALQYIHSQKVIHRDIKPENIHISTTGVVKLMDFGIAKTEGLQMTRAGYVLGTPYYMAPEQVMGAQITEQVDVYAFGVLLFELMTGAKPISGDTVERIFYCVLNEPLNLDPLRAAAVPEAIINLVAQCTAKKPEARPQGFGPVVAELERVLAEIDAPTMVLPPPPVPPPAPRPAWMLPAVLAAVVIVGAGIYFAARPKPVPKAPELPKSLTLPSGDMVLVPAGTFLFGETKEQVELPAFYVDRTEVTNAAYAKFASATGYALPGDFPRDKPDYPIVNVSINDAHAFAKWAGKRLPTAREWEKAARGTDGRLFPWGNEPEAARANVKAPGLRPAGDLPEGASPYGALNMVGNAWELIEQLVQPSPAALAFFKKAMKPPPGADETWFEIKGQGFGGELSNGAVWDFAPSPGRFKDGNIGFRCVK